VPSDCKSCPLPLNSLQSTLYSSLVIAVNASTLCDLGGAGNRRLGRFRLTMPRIIQIVGRPRSLPLLRAHNRVDCFVEESLDELLVGK